MKLSNIWCNWSPRKNRVRISQEKYLNKRIDKNFPNVIRELWGYELLLEWKKCLRTHIWKGLNWIFQGGSRWEERG